MGDLIDRQDAIDWCLEGLNNMPSAQPKTEEQTAKSTQNVSINDLISRKAAIDAINKYACNTQRIYEAIKALPSAQPDLSEYSDKLWRNAYERGKREAQPEQQWIPCSERLPEKYIGQWLCCTSDGDVMILPYDTPGDGTKECVFYKLDDYGYSYKIFDVIAWMPLPSPYQAERREE